MSLEGVSDVLVCFYCCDIRSRSKASWRGKGLAHIFRVTVLTEAETGTQGVNLKAGSETKAMEGTVYCLAPYNLPSLLS